MKPSILSYFRKQTKLGKFLIFLIISTQLYSQSFYYAVNKKEYVVPIKKIDYSSVKAQNNFSTGKNEKSIEDIQNIPKVTSSIVTKNTHKSIRNLNEKRNNVSRISFFSDIKEGVIGTDAQNPIDQIYDNIFTINVNSDIDREKVYILEYDLYGVKDYFGISKFINDELSIGGKNIEKNNIWSHQQEPINGLSLNKGNNYITFTIPSNANYSYRIKNLRISISETSHYDVEKAIAVNTVSKLCNKDIDAELILDKVKLTIDKNSLKENEVFSITPLRDIDMPALTPEMVNVTAQNSGYRFLPHGEHFRTPAKISLGYDKTKIPEGYTEQDIKTFFFDRNQKKWIALEKDSLAQKENILISKTTHFTDMVNGIIKVPESPETGTYAPNSMMDVKPANPADGVVGIAPPTPNSMGTVNTSFPIKLPAGRNGMQPSLSINYNSEGGNGWLGLGWDLSIPAISIDTRWGVPTYDTSFESEIYTLGEEQLTFKDGSNYVLPNRTEGFQKVRGTGDKQFYPRIEGAYNKIIRHGSSPSTYWWEVISKDGTKSIFGDDGTVPQSDKETYTLADANGNIGYWALYKTIDTNKNYVVYTYDKSIYTGIPGNGGQELHINEIKYTQHETQNPSKNYKVKFNSTTGRDDLQINGRLGFLEVESKRLSSIEIKYGEGIIRSYDLEYRNDDASFHKSLLKSITEKDASGAVFYTNKMEYNEAPATLFGNPSIWNAPDKATFSELSSSGNFTQGYSMLSGNYSKSTGYSFGVNVGLYDITANPTGDRSIATFRKGTFGVHGSASNSSSDSKINIIDIDGDNLPDRVYYNNGIISYSKNISLSSIGTQKFSSIVTVAGITEIGKSKSSAWGVGINGNYNGGSLGFDYSNNTSTTKSYFMDFNSDGLVDFVKEGKVLFNRIVGGVPTFNEDSSLTPYPISITTSNIQASTSLFDNEDEKEKKMMLEQNPLHDLVRVWVAPKDGTITVKNKFNLNNITCSSDEDCSKADGVAVSFQYKDNTPIVKSIVAGDTTIYSFTDQLINISKGEKLYFRVSSKYDGTLDQVSWDPEIIYSTPSNPSVDSDNKNLSTYKFQEDFVNTSSSPYVVGSTGNFNIYLDKSIGLSDDAKIVWNINGTEYTYDVYSGLIYNGNINSSPIQLSANDKISVKVYTDTQIDWTKFKVIPEFIDAKGEKYYIQTEYSMYNDRGSIETYTISLADIGKNIFSRITNFPSTNFNYEGAVTSSLKFINKPLSKTIFSRKLINNVYVNTTQYVSTYTIGIDDVGKTVYIETTVKGGKNFATNLPTLTTTMDYFSGNYIDTPGTSMVQSFQNKTGTIFVGGSNQLTLSLTGSISPESSVSTAELNIYDGQGNIIDSLFVDSSDSYISSVSVPQGIYFYELIMTNGGRGRITINNVGASQVMKTAYLIAHKSIFAPDNPSTALVNNKYDNRFGILYRGWGGFVLNGNNPANGNIIENYTLTGNYANGGSDVEMKVDESRLALSQVYSTDPAANGTPTVNNPTVDPNGNVTLQDNNASLSKNYFLLLTSDINNIDKGRWTDVDSSIYINPNNTNSSRAGVHSIDVNFNNFSLNQSTGFKLSAPSIVLKNQSISVAGGLSSGVADVNVSSTIFSEAKSIRNVLDYNGDGFPDDFNKTNVKITNSLGFLSMEPPLNVGSQSISRASNSGISSGFSFVHGESARMAFIQPVGKNSKNRSYTEGAIIAEEESRKGAMKLSISGNLEHSTEYAKQSFLDINGDGLPDKYNNGKFELNIGKQFIGNDSWNNSFVSEGESNGAGLGGGISLFRGSFDFGLNYSSTTSTTSKELIDINGDRLPDKVEYSGSLPNIYLNFGNGISTTSLPNSNSLSVGDLHKDVSVNVGGNIAGTVMIPIPLAPTTGLKLNITAGVSKGFSTTKSNSTFKDMNGDGYPDFVTSDDADNVSVQLNQIGTTNLLKKVTLPMGGTWEVTYARKGNTYNMPQSKYVLETITVKDNFSGDDSFKPASSKFSVEYGNGFYSRRERAFYGFDSVITKQLDTQNNDQIYRYTQQFYNNSNYYLKGLQVREVMYSPKNKTINPNNDIKWTEKETDYSIRFIHLTNNVYPNIYYGEEEKKYQNYAYFVASPETRSFFYEGQDVLKKKTVMKIKSFDQWGNPTEIKDNGDLNIGTPDELTSLVTYTDVTNGKYVIAPTSIVSTATGVYRGRTAVYDPITGDLTSITFIALDNPTYNFEYDVYGNIIKSKGPKNYQNTEAQRFYHLYTYDDSVKTYPVKVEDAFGYSSTATYDLRFGVPLYTEDMNLQPMKYVYDSFGRNTMIVGPYELFNNIEFTIKHNYPASFNANTTQTQYYAETKRYDPANVDNRINTIIISDGLGTPIQVKKSVNIFDPEKEREAEKYSVSGKVVQDAFGRALKTYYPTVENDKVVTYTSEVDSVKPTENTYDVLDRVTSTKLPGEDLFSTIKYGLGTDRKGRIMFETIFTDELGTVKKTYTDSKGRTTTVREPSNTGEITTSFTHDAIGDILEVADVQDNKTISVYDNLGRRISYKHPDSGITTYEYDAASNLRYKTNSANEKVEYIYDFNRLSEIKYPNYTENNIKYYYGKAKDASAMDNNAVGRLWYQTDATGSQYFKYGKMGELTYQRRSVAVPGAGVYWFGTEWEYDTWNRVRSITYPDGEKVTYLYNTGGNLRAISSVKDGKTQPIISYIGYDKFEQRNFLLYGNGTKTTYEYETERRRLLKLNSQTAAVAGTNGVITKPSRLFQQNIYQYDVVSNVLQIHNNAPFAPAGLLGGGTNYAYGYDDLYRLTSASGNWRGLNSVGQEERQRFTVTMAYDNMHNVTRKEQKHERALGATGNTWINMNPTSYRLNYKYPVSGPSSTRPHAPTTIVDEPNKEGALCCDVNNPQVKFQNYVYDAKGNPTEINQQTCNNTEAKTRYTWDEENRLRFVDTNPSTAEVDGSAIYTYDAGGERIIKNVLSTAFIFRTSNIEKPRPGTLNDYTIYPNGLLSVKISYNSRDIYPLGSNAPVIEYTKHYYVGSQRISSKLGLGQNVGQFNCNWLIVPFGSGSVPINEKTVAKEKLDANTAASLAIMQANNITPPVNYGQNAGYTENCVSSYAGNQELDMYWYHPDHLGSSSFITGIDGEVTQNIDYFPSGEVFVENHKNSYNTPYKFNGKEQDSETDYYYYGARYYNPRVSLWLNVDPLAEKYPGWSPYVYCMNNPINAVDPNGEEVVWIGFGGNYSKIIRALNRTYAFNAVFARFINNQDNVFIQPSSRGYFGLADPRRTANGYNLFLGNNGFLKNGKLTADPTFIAKVILHEGLHHKHTMGVAEGNQSKYPTLDRHLQIQKNTPGYEGDHEAMAEGNIQSFVKGMRQFDKQYGSTHSNDWYNAMAWFGSLERATDDWQNMDSNTKSKYTEIIQNEQAYMNYLDARAGGDKNSIKSAKSKVNWDLFKKTRTSSK